MRKSLQIGLILVLANFLLIQLCMPIDGYGDYIKYIILRGDVSFRWDKFLHHEPISRRQYGGLNCEEIESEEDVERIHSSKTIFK